MHICCGPCSIYPIQALRDDRVDVMGFYYRNNIHPYTECQQREETLTAYAQSISLNLIVQPDYAMETFIRNVAFREAERCTYCYHDRLTTTARYAKKGKFDGFTSTLLYSRFQKHDQIRSIGEAVGKSVVFKAEPSYPVDVVHYRFMTGDGQEARVAIPAGLGVKA